MDKTTMVVAFLVAALFGMLVYFECWGRAAFMSAGLIICLADELISAIKSKQSEN